MNGQEKLENAFRAVNRQPDVTAKIRQSSDLPTARVPKVEVSEHSHSIA
jgi:hypothetical protein